MKRLWLTALLLAAVNALYWAWSQDHLQALGWGPERVRESERLEQQVKPEAMQVLPREALQEGVGCAPAFASDCP